MDIEDLYSKNIDIERRTIFFSPWQGIENHSNWEVSDASIQNIIKGLYLLDNGGKDDITIIWNSHGGEWAAGMALYDYIQEIKNNVIMKCYGRVRSMGTIILQACNKRMLSPNCQFMIHYGASKEEDESRNVIANVKEEERTNEVMEQIYLKKIKEKHPEMTLEVFRKNMAYNQWFTSNDAILLGLADEIIK